MIIEIFKNCSWLCLYFQHLKTFFFAHHYVIEWSISKNWRITIQFFYIHLTCSYTITYNHIQFYMFCHLNSVLFSGHGCIFYAQEKHDGRNG